MRIKNDILRYLNVVSNVRNVAVAVSFQNLTLVNIILMCYRRSYMAYSFLMVFLHKQVDKNAELAAKWKYCALSQEKLRRPIVSCELGR